jgi:hypothetical protein
MGVARLEDKQDGPDVSQVSPPGMPGINLLVPTLSAKEKKEVLMTSRWPFVSAFPEPATLAHRGGEVEQSGGDWRGIIVASSGPLAALTAWGDSEALGTAPAKH